MLKLADGLIYFAVFLVVIPTICLLASMLTPRGQKAIRESFLFYKFEEVYKGITFTYIVKSHLFKKSTLEIQTEDANHLTFVSELKFPAFFNKLDKCPDSPSLVPENERLFPFMSPPITCLVHTENLRHYSSKHHNKVFVWSNGKWVDHNYVSFLEDINQMSEMIRQEWDKKQAAL